VTMYFAMKTTSDLMIAPEAVVLFVNT
jgi:hypothetical protein